MTKQITVYTDTSVFGGAVDLEFKDASQAFFQQVEQGRFQLVISALVHDELQNAPEPVRNVFLNMLPLAHVLDITQEARDLQQAYLQANILTHKHDLDALHVALATTFDCTIIISWNFKHIVNFKRIPLYNAVNVVAGYKPIAIYSPLEVIVDED